MEIDQQGQLANEKQEEKTSCKKQKITQIEQPEFFVDKVKSTTPLQHTNHKAQSSNLTNTSTSNATEGSKEADGKMSFIREISFHEKRPLIGNEWQNMGTYHSVRKKEAFLGTEESKGFNFNIHKVQGKEPLICIESFYKETSCLMSNVHGGIESSDECITTRSNFKGKISLIGVRRQKNGRYGSVIRDTIRRKQVWLGTFDTIEEASQAYFSKKSELENEILSQQGNKENKPKKNLDQIQQPESPLVPSLYVADDQTLDTASVDGRNKTIDSHKATMDIDGVHKNKTSGKEPESSKETPCPMANVHGTESYDECNTSTSCNEGKISLVGIRRQKNGRYGSVIRDTIRRKQVWLGTFDTIEEASQAYFSKKSELENEILSQQGNKENKPKKNLDQIQQPESPLVPSLFVADDQTLDTASVDGRNKTIDSHKATMDIDGVHKNKTSGKEPESSKETPCPMANVHGTESYDECNTSTSCNEGKISLVGIRRQKNGRYGSVIRDTIRRKQVWLGTFDTIEEASQAYFSKKSELENEILSQQGNKENKPKKNLDQIQQPESPLVPSLFVADDQTLDTASVDGRNKTIDSHEATMDIDGVHKNKTSGKEPESSKETPCPMANVHGTESYDECNTSTSCNEGKISLVGIRRQKNGRYGAVIRDTIRRKQVWLDTFDTIEEASQAYFSRKSELENEKLNPQGNKENRPNKNPDPIQQPESPIVPSLSVADDQTMETASVDRRNKRTDSHEAIMDIVGIHKNKTSGENPESSKEPACLIVNVHGIKSYDECNTSTSCNPKAKISLIGIRRQKNGRYAAVIRDRFKHKKVWLGTFDTVEEASKAYLSKKSELKKLGQQGNKPKKNCDQVQHPESPVVASMSARVSRRNKRIDSHKTTKHIFGVHQRKDSGKYTTEIRNPISKKRIWLGTFATAEEASRAYQSKKLEFQKLVNAKQDGNSEKLVNVKQGHENVNCEHKSAGRSPEIDVPFSNSSNGGTDQRIDSHEMDTAEEALHAYQSKKFDLQSSKKVELQNDMPTDSSAGEKQEGQDDDKDLWMGEWVQLPGNTAVKFSLKLGLPIIDNYGSLLGEFSSLDDLSICKTEDGNET